MAEYVISTCSTADLPKNHFENRDIHYVCFHADLGGQEYLDDLGESIPLKDFYQEMREGVITKTSQVNTEEYIEYFEPFLQAGKDILHVCLTTGISGTFNAANVAKDMLSEKYPDRKLYIVDSFTASAGLGLLMDELADVRDQGKSIDEAYEWVLEYRYKIQGWFFTSDLTYLIRGGRVSKTSGFVGTLLNICPLLTIDVEGKLIPKSKIRTKKKVMAATVEKMLELADNGKDYNGKCFISHSDCYEDARETADMIEEAMPALKGKVYITDIGTTIGAHTGPGTVALFFVGQKRTAEE